MLLSVEVKALVVEECPWMIYLNILVMYLVHHLVVDLVEEEEVRRVRKGSNLRVKLRLSLEDVVNGVQKKIKVQKLVAASGVEFSTCPSCNGTGQVTRVTNTILGAMQTSSTCPNCKGSGQTISKRPSGVDTSGLEKKETIIEIEIPPGVRRRNATEYARERK